MKKLIFIFTFFTLAFFIYAQPNKPKEHIKCNHEQVLPKPEHPLPFEFFDNDSCRDKHPFSKEKSSRFDIHNIHCHPHITGKGFPDDNRAKVAKIRAQSDFMHSILPIVAIIIIFTASVLIVLIVTKFKMKKQQAAYDIVLKAILAGKEIPQELLEHKNKSNKLNNGILLIALGMGLIPLFGFIVSIEYIWIGILFVLLGIGQIISYYILRNLK